MFNNPFLGDVAADKHKRQQLDHLLRITAPHERIILAGAIAALLALLGWMLFGGVALSISTNGVLIKPGTRHEVVTLEPGRLLEFLVEPGERVAVGAPIARQSVPELEREIAALRSRVNLLEAEVGLTDEQNMRALLTSSRAALLQMEAQRSVRELVVSHTEGELTALLSAPGEYLPAGAAIARLRDSEDQLLHAVLRVDQGTALRFESGMQAFIHVETPYGAAGYLEGNIVSVTGGGLPDWLAALPPGAPTSSYRVDISLQQAPTFFIPDGAPCHVYIPLERVSLLALSNLE